MIRHPVPACRWRGRALAPGHYECSSCVAVFEGELATIADCRACQVRDHAPGEAERSPLPAAGTVRHLAYHCYPVGTEWGANLQELKRRLSLFNGLRLVAVAEGPGAATAVEVGQVLAGLDCDVFGVVNDAGLKEMASYPTLMRRLAGYTEAGDVHWYGHAKGVTSAAWSPSVKEWREAMYHCQLDYWPLMRRLLVDFAAVGQYRRPRHIIIGSPCRWHFSGSFSWRRHLPLFRRNWDSYDRHWCGSESHLGRIYRANEVYNLYGERPPAGLDLYLERTWVAGLRAQHDAWCAEHAGMTQTPVLATVILTACRQAELVHQAIASVRAQTVADWQLLVVDAGPLHAAAAYDRYAGDARISVMTTGETDAMRRCLCIQGWAINEAWRRGRVRGDLICCLSDDDVLAPTWLETVLNRSARSPGEGAWVGHADRAAVRKDGSELFVGRLVVDGSYGPGRTLRCVADGMQLAVRRASWRPWPEVPELSREADGHWMERVTADTAAVALDALVGRHRHTDLSAFTTPADVGVRC